jgi:probable HAF family extracellular repeat protein
MGSMTYSLSNLNYPDSLRTLALGINNRGEVVGAYSLFSLTSASFLYQDGNYVPLGAPGDPNAYTQANAINNRGEIVGNVRFRSGLRRMAGSMRTEPYRTTTCLDRAKPV